MKDTKEIILFLDGNRFPLVDVASELMRRFKEIGEPIIVPESEQSKNSPLIVFTENTDIQLQCNYTSINILVNHKYFDNLSSVIFDLIDTFEEFGSNFLRIGYVSNIFIPPRYVEKCKNRFLNMEFMPEIGDFNLSWYTKFDVDGHTVNCWERNITDSISFKDLLVQFDINTNIGDKIVFDMKFIKSFLKSADNYIKSRLDY